MARKKGYKQSAEHIAKRIRHGKDHANWKGDEITEKSGRSRALVLFPELPPCLICGSPRSERHHIDGNTINNKTSNVAPLCRKCHMSTDGRLARLKSAMGEYQKLATAAAAEEKRSRTHCKRGHPLSGDNLFLTSSGGRGCKECRKIHKKTYRSKEI